MGNVQIRYVRNTTLKWLHLLSTSILGLVACVLTCSAQDFLVGPPTHSFRPPAGVVGTWKVCRTIGVSSNASTGKQYNDNPIGQKITFSKGVIIFRNKNFTVVDYKIGRIDSSDDFRFEYGVSTKQLGIDDMPIVVKANLTQGGADEFISSDLFPGKKKLILGWNGWFLLAMPENIPCHKPSR